MTRTLAVVLSLVMCLPCACQKQEGKVARPEGYEQATDGPPSQAMYAPDANLLRDQAEVAREYGGRPAAGTTSRATSAPAAAPAAAPPPATAPAPAVAPPPAAAPGEPAPVPFPLPPPTRLPTL